MIDPIIYGIILDKAGSYEYLMELREIMEAGVMKLAMENAKEEELAISVIRPPLTRSAA